MQFLLLARDLFAILLGCLQARKGKICAQLLPFPPSSESRRPRDPESVDGSTCVIRFHAGPPYEDVAFKLINKEWETAPKKGFRCVFERGEDCKTQALVFVMNALQSGNVVPRQLQCEKC